LGQRYSDLVDYSRLDPVKREALKIFASTFQNPDRLRIKVAPAGETAAVLDLLDYDFMLAFNVEGLGTKSLIADEMYSRSLREEAGPKMDAARFYRFLGQDAVAMSVTDLVAVGADPVVYADIIASGNSRWFDDAQRNEELINGYRVAANIAGCAIPQGETPTLPDIVSEKTIELAGSSMGIIKPKERFNYGQKIREGDIIYGMPSGSICANGVSKARAIVKRLNKGFFTQLSSGKTIGEELLTPTPIYVRPIIEMFERGVDLHYISPITGHGWRKIARSRFAFTYIIEQIPEPPPLFSMLIEWGKDFGFNVSDEENYQVWNMGVFITLIAPKEDADRIVGTGEKYNVEIYQLGRVEKGAKQVILKPKRIVYSE